MDCNPLNSANNLRHSCFLSIREKWDNTLCSVHSPPHASYRRETRLMEILCPRSEGILSVASNLSLGLLPNPQIAIGCYIHIDSLRKDQNLNPLLLPNVSLSYYINLKYYKLKLHNQGQAMWTHTQMHAWTCMFTCTHANPQCRVWWWQIKWRLQRFISSSLASC